MAADWTIAWLYRFSLIMEAFGLDNVRDSRKMPNGVRLVLGRLMENAQWVVFTATEKGKDSEKRVLPGELVEYLTDPAGVASKIAYTVYIDARDGAGLKPKSPAGGASHKPKDETQGDSEPESETQGSLEGEPTPTEEPIEASKEDSKDESKSKKKEKVNK